MENLHYYRGFFNYQMQQTGGKKEFVATILNPKHEIFIVHVAFLSSTLLNVHLSCKFQISGLIAEEASTKVLNKYINFVDIFSLDLVSELPKYIKINNHTIKLVESQQPHYKSINSLEPVELEILKTYI